MQHFSVSFSTNRRNEFSKVLYATITVRQVAHKCFAPTMQDGATIPLGTICSVQIHSLTTALSGISEADIKGHTFANCMHWKLLQSLKHVIDTMFWILPITFTVFHNHRWHADPITYSDRNEKVLRPDTMPTKFTAKCYFCAEFECEREIHLARKALGNHLYLWNIQYTGLGRFGSVALPSSFKLVCLESTGPQNR